MEKIGTLILITILLGACTDESATEEMKPVATAEEAVDGRTQEEANAETKEFAIELDFIKANGDEVEEGTLVKATGEITLISLEGIRGGDFTLTTKEGDGYGMYNVINFNTTGFVIEEGQMVTVYGVYDARDKYSMPQFIATIIE